jgi:hypothetical protein
MRVEYGYFPGRRSLILTLITPTHRGAEERSPLGLATFVPMVRAGDGFELEMALH